MWIDQNIIGLLPGPDRPPTQLYSTSEHGTSAESASLKRQKINISNRKREAICELYVDL